MNKTRVAMKIVDLISVSVVALISLIYLVTNVRLLFSGDASIYSYPVGGILTCIGKIFMYLYFVGYAVFSYIYLLRRYHKEMTPYYLGFSITYILIAVIYIIFNSIGLNAGIEGILVNVAKMMFPISLFAILMSYILDFMEQ